MSYGRYPQEQSETDDQNNGLLIDDDDVLSEGDNSVIEEPVATEEPNGIPPRAIEGHGAANNEHDTDEVDANADPSDVSGIFPVWVTNVTTMTAKHLSEVASGYGKIHGVGIFQVRQTPHKICQVLAKSPTCAQKIAQNINGSRLMGQYVVASLASCAIPQSLRRGHLPDAQELQPLGRFWTAHSSPTHNQARTTGKPVKRSDSPSTSRIQGTQSTFKRRKTLLQHSPVPGDSETAAPPENQQRVFDHFTLIENTVQLSGEGVEMFFNAEEETDWRTVVFLLSGGQVNSCRADINTVLILQNSLEDARSIELSMRLSNLLGVTKLIFPSTCGFWQERVNSALQLLTTKYHSTLRTVRNVRSLDAVSSEVVERATVIRVTDLAYPPVESARVISLFAELPEANETIATFGCAFPNPPYCSSSHSRRITLQARTAFPLSFISPVQRHQDLCRSVTDFHLVAVVKHKHEETVFRMGTALQIQLCQLREYFPRLRYFHFRLALQDILFDTVFSNDGVDALAIAAHVEKLAKKITTWNTGFSPPFQHEVRLYYDFELGSPATEGRMTSLADAQLDGVLQDFHMRTLESGPDRWTIQSSTPTSLLDKAADLVRIVDNAVTVARTLSTRYLTLCAEMELQENRLTARIEKIHDLKQRNRLLRNLLDHALKLAILPEEEMPQLEAQEVPVREPILKDEAEDVAGIAQTAVFLRSLGGIPPKSEFVTARTRTSFEPPYDYRTFSINNIVPETTADEVRSFVLYFGMMCSVRVYVREQATVSEWFAVVQMTNSASTLAVMMILSKQAHLSEETFAYRRVATIPEGRLQASDAYLHGEPVYVRVEHSEGHKYAYYPAYVHHVRSPDHYEVLSVYGLQRVGTSQIRMRPDNQFQTVLINSREDVPTVTLLRNVTNRTLLIRLGISPTLWNIRYLLWTFVHSIDHVQASSPNKNQQFLLKVLTHSQADRDALLSSVNDIFPPYYSARAVLPDRLGRAPRTWNFTMRRFTGKMIWKSRKRPSISGPYAPGQDNVRMFTRPGLLSTMAQDLVSRFQRQRHEDVAEPNAPVAL